MNFKRNILNKLEESVSRSPVTLLTGARQVGKTTLMKSMARHKEYTYITFDDLSFLSAAQDDPAGFIAGISSNIATQPVILDEVQRVPHIFLPIKKLVDEHRAPGMFILTGSANPLLIPKLGDSLAGRMEILELFPLSQGELRGVKENFVDQVFKNNLFKSLEPQLSREDLNQAVLTGGYPLVQELDTESRNAWFNSYITTVLYREVKELSNISDLTEFPKLLRLLGLRVGNLLNVSELSRSIGIPATTLHRYLALLQMLFLLNLQQPWSTNKGKRLVKSPKISLIDSGLISFLLQAHLESFDMPAVGGLFENFVLNEIIKQTSWCDTKVSVFHYRTLTGIEVDIVLEDWQSRIVAIEVKNSSTVSSSDFKGLKHLQEDAKDNFLQGIVIYRGNQVVPFGKNLTAVPVESLWTT